MKQRGRIKALGQNYDLQNWNTEHHERNSVIALITRNGKWETVAETKGPHHKVLADYILFTIKTHTQYSEQLEEAINALKLCLESKDLSWEAEQACEVFLRKAQGKA